MNDASPVLHTNANLTWAWLGVVSVAASTFFLVTTEFLPVGMLTSIAQNLHVTPGRAGLTITLPGVVAAFAAPILSMIVGRLDRRIILCVLTALIAVSNAIAAGAISFEILLLARVLLGISVGGLWSFGIAAARRLVPEEMGARATAIISAGIGFGTIVGVPAGSLVGAWLGWRGAFAIAAVFGGLVLLAEIIFLPRLPVQTAIGLRQFSRIFKVSRARAGLLGIALAVCGHFLSYTYLEPYLRRVASLGELSLASVLMVFALTGIFGTFSAGALARNGTGRAFVSVTAMQSLAILLLGYSTTSMPVLILLVAAWGFAFGAIPVLMQIWTFEAAPALYEGAAAIIVTAFQVGLASGAFAGGLIVDNAGIREAFFAGGCISALAAAVLKWAPPVQKH